MPRPAPIDFNSVLDRDALSARLATLTGDAKTAQDVLNSALSDARDAAEARLVAREDGLRVARLLAHVADAVVASLYDFLAVGVAPAPNSPGGERFAVVAVGGYGRGELAPGSDLDILFLSGAKGAPIGDKIAGDMVHALWDLGFKVAQSSRSVNDSLKFAKEDHKFQTALLEMRLIAGDAALANELKTRFRKDVASQRHPEYIAIKLRERDERHARAGASRYMVEPNIKEGKGGLRDLHTLFWMARRRYGFNELDDYVKAAVFSAQEVRRFRRALEFLWTVRCHMHFVTGRAEEKLSFDLQPELATRMGYSSRANQSHVERFMRHYFLVAKEVGALTRTLCAKLEADHAKGAPLGLKRFLPVGGKTAPLPAGFRDEGGRLGVTKPDVLADPVNLLRLFQIADANNLDVHPAALGEAARRAKTINAPVRLNAEARAAFIEVASSPRQPAAALRLMNEAGVLGQFVPEFGRIVAQMQFNMYHHFTVDEHTFRAIDAISEIEKGAHAAQHPLSTAIFPKIINRRALYLAMLLHDTGKGAGDQQVEGEKSARAACKRLGLSKEEVDLVGWLVRHHLMMSDVAQKRDIGDPRTVAQFAETVGTLERLRLLLVLTVADIRAVGPGVWNDWKGQLLRDLYRLTEAAFHGGRSDEQGVRAHLSVLAADAKEQLLRDIAADAPLDDWLGALEDSYWLNHDAEALAWHAGEVTLAHAVGEGARVAARFRPVQGVTELLVYCRDRPGLFASLAAAISNAGADIAGARVHTTKDGAAFDVFSIQTAQRKPFGMEHEHVLERLKKQVADAAVNDHAPPPRQPLAGRAAAFTIEPWALIDNDVARHSTVIEVSGRDRHGLLADLARVMADAGLSIVTAHIDSHGARASDAFYVQSEGGQLRDPERIETLRASLEAALAAADDAKHSRAVARASTLR